MLERLEFDPWPGGGKYASRREGKGGASPVFCEVILFQSDKPCEAVGTQPLNGRRLC